MEPVEPVQPFHRKEHTAYLFALEDSKDLYSIGKYLTEHLKMAGGYWSLNSLCALQEQLPREKIQQLTAWIASCQNPDGGFGGNNGHDSHITSTHYALLVLLLFDEVKYQNSQCRAVDTDKLARYTAGLQQPNGSFFGDKWGEVDTRFSYCGLSTLALLNRLELIDVKKAAEYCLSCLNFDGSFGGIPGAQSHGAYVFCCVGALKIAGFIDSFDHDELARWLCERQTTKGGFNGRPEKLPDVCYSWWIFSSLCIIKRRDWIDEKALQGFILACQDIEGGISDRPGNTVDVFHTFFGLAALSLLNGPKYSLIPIDPTFAIPRHIVERIPHLAKYL